VRDLESIFRAHMLKIVLQHNPFESGRRGEIGARLQRVIAVIVAIRLTERHGMSGGITPA
jgi:hypothetical protein